MGEVPKQLIGEVRPPITGKTNRYDTEYKLRRDVLNGNLLVEFTHVYGISN